MELISIWKLFFFFSNSEIEKLLYFFGYKMGIFSFQKILKNLGIV